MSVLTTSSRAGTAADAVAGVAPREVVAPRDVPELAQALQAATAQGRTVVPVGAATKTGWAAPPSSCDLLVTTTGLDRIVEYSPGDLVVVAEAGVRLETLQTELAQSGQMLALDSGEKGSTLGGVVSANASGPRRLRFGTVRDLLIGVTVVLADGSIASAGGKVVKNVAGYDLGKLYTGAHGSLGVVVSTTWRLHPLPPDRAVVVVDVRDAAEAGHFAQQINGSTLTPTACEIALVDGSLTLAVLFEAISESVAHQSAALVDLLGTGSVVESLPQWFGQRPGGEQELVLRLAYEPAALPVVLSALPRPASVIASACTGVAYVAVAAEQGAAALPGLRAALAPVDGTAVVLHAPESVRGHVDHWGPVGDALALMGSVKDRFDPDRLLSPGRFVGGL